MDGNVTGYEAVDPAATVAFRVVNVGPVEVPDPEESTSNCQVLEVPPPGPGVCTETVKIPADAISLAGTVAVSCVPLTNCVARAEVPQLTTELPVNPEPFTVNVKEASAGAYKSGRCIAERRNRILGKVNGVSSAGYGTRTVASGSCDCLDRLRLRHSERGAVHIRTGSRRCPIGCVVDDRIRRCIHDRDRLHSGVGSRRNAEGWCRCLGIRRENEAVKHGAPIEICSCDISAGVDAEPRASLIAGCSGGRRIETCDGPAGITLEPMEYAIRIRIETHHIVASGIDYERYRSLKHCERGSANSRSIEGCKRAIGRAHKSVMLIARIGVDTGYVPSRSMLAGMVPCDLNPIPLPDVPAPGASNEVIVPLVYE